MHTDIAETGTNFAPNVSTQLDPQLADRLLNQLATDDNFRQLFRASPQAALRQLGYQPRATSILPDLSVQLEPEPFSHCEIGELASKEAILAAREELREVLIKGLAYHTPTLDAANVAERRRLR